MNKSRLITYFLIIEVGIYMAFLINDTQGGTPYVSSLLKFSSIILCYMITEKSFFYIKAAMAFTVFSDFFLVMTDIYLPGLCSFIMVELCYYIYLKGINKIWSHLALIGILTFLICLNVDFLLFPVDLLLILSVFYFLSLLGNIIIVTTEITTLTQNRSRRIFLLSLLLILLCDINVALSNLYSYHNVPVISNLVNFSGVAMWLFYLPSQLLMALNHSSMALSSSSNSPIYHSYH